MRRIIALAILINCFNSYAIGLAQKHAVAYGDSITAGAIVTPANTYAQQLALEAGAALQNYAVSGQIACQMAHTQVFAHEAPRVSDGNVYSTMMIGTNDSNVQGVGDYQGIFGMCLRAAITWLTIPAEKKALANSDSCRKRGSWTYDPRLPIAALRSVNQGDSLTCDLKTDGGPLFLWFVSSDASRATFSYSVDGGAKNRVLTYSRTSIRTRDGRGLSGEGAIRIPNLAPGAHSVTITVESPNSSTNVVEVYGIGTPDISMKATPRLFVGGVPFQLNDKKSADSLAYYEMVDDIVKNLRADGLPVEFVPTRNFLKGTASEMADDLHPTLLGHRHLKNAFEDSILKAPASIF